MIKKNIKTILDLRIHQKKSFDDIGLILNISRQTVRNVYDKEMFKRSENYPLYQECLQMLREIRRAKKRKLI